MSDVFQRNFAVSNGNSSQSDSDNDLIQPQNDIVKLVSLECIFVLLNNIVEILQLAFKHDLNQLVVRVCVLKVKIISENLSVRNFALQQFNDNSSLLALDFESFCVVGRFTDGLVETRKGVCVLSSDSLDSASVKKVLAEFVV